MHARPPLPPQVLRLAHSAARTHTRTHAHACGRTRADESGAHRRAEWPRAPRPSPTCCERCQFLCWPSSTVRWLLALRRLLPIRRRPTPSACTVSHAPSACTIGQHPSASTHQPAPACLHPSAGRPAPVGLHPSACTRRPAPISLHPSACTRRPALLVALDLSVWLAGRVWNILDGTF